MYIQSRQNRFKGNINMILAIFFKCLLVTESNKLIEYFNYTNIKIIKTTVITILKFAHEVLVLGIADKKICFVCEKK